jgi:fructose-1,6-bisphosphatase I
MYPPTEKAPNGKLRLMYEANPMSMLIEQARGNSFSGLERTLEFQPRELHQPASVILGSAGEVENVQEFLQ